MYFFFYKQKTAYEMPFGDWSSDVSSSDLTVRGPTYAPAAAPAYDALGYASWYGSESGNQTANGEKFRPGWITAAHRTLPLPTYVEVTALRSEEHTSELQSLMRISYAVFCLKKKTNIQNNSKEDLMTYT